MTLAPLVVGCPHCGSTDIVYSCKPECCFNHVCNQCYTTFGLETTNVGVTREGLSVPADPDPSAPAAPCARCGESKVFAMVEQGIPSGQLLCASCNAVLTLVVTNVTEG